MRNNFNPIKKCFINPLIQHEVFYQSYNPITVFPTISGRKRKVVDFPRTGSHWFRNSFIELSSLPSSPSSFLWLSLSLYLPLFSLFLSLALSFEMFWFLYSSELCNLFSALLLRPTKRERGRAREMTSEREERDREAEGEWERMKKSCWVVQSIVESEKNEALFLQI